MLFLKRILIPTYLFAIKIIINAKSVDLFKTNNPVCLTDECILFAADLINSINASVNPCDNFYEYVCGNDLAKKKVSMFTLGEENVNAMLQSKLDELVNEGNTKPYVQFYKSCKNITRINERGLKPLEMFLQKFGGWPLLSTSNSTEKLWSSFLIDMWNSGIQANYMFSFYIPSRTGYSVIISPSFILRTPVLLNGISNDRVKEYFDFMMNIAVTLGADSDKIHEDLKNLLDFEIQLAKIVPLPKKIESVDLTLNEIKLKYQDLPWGDIIESMLPKSVTKYENIIINFENLNFFNKLNNLLTNTSNKIIKNYLIWRTIYDSIDLLPQNFQLIKFNFNQISTFDRSKYCLGLTYNAFKLNMAALYVREINSKSRINITSQMANNIHEQFVNLLKQNEWMDSETKPNAVKKIENMKILIGYTDELLNDNNIDIYYEQLQIDSYNFFETYYNVNNYMKKLDLKDWTKFDIASTYVNAQYYDTTNKIGIHMALIMTTLRYNNLPMYINYGALGSIIGHEMAHGFDPMCVYRDANGNENDWLTPKSKKEFLNRIQCLVEQYNNFTEPISQIKVDGNFKSMENTADVVGFKVAQLAYDQWINENHIEESLPGFENMTPKQLYWITIAHDFCGYLTIDESIDIVNMDYHSPARFRVNGAVQDSIDFAKEFNCPVNSPMNPIKKCEIY